MPMIGSSALVFGSSSCRFMPKSSESHRNALKSSADALDLGVADICDQHGEQRARVDDLDLVVLPFHLERGEVEVVPAAGKRLLKPSS